MKKVVLERIAMDTILDERNMRYLMIVINIIEHMI